MARTILTGGFVALLLTALVVIFRMSVSETIENVEPHAYDNIISGQNTPVWSATVTVSLLRRKSVQRELNLRPDQLEKIQSELDSLAIRGEEVKRRIRKENPDRPTYLPYKDSELDSLCLETVEVVLKVLDADQSTRMNQLAMQLQGRDAVFGADCVKKLSLTPAQLHQLKDLAVETSHVRSQYVRRWREANEEDRERATSDHENAQAELAARFDAIFTEHQKKIYKQLLGEKMEF